jgi:hypothetical protein
MVAWVSLSLFFLTCAWLLSIPSGVLFLLEPISPCYPRVTCMFYLSCACFVLEHFKLVRRWGSWCKRRPITMNDGWKLVRNIPLLGIYVLFFWLIVRQSSLCVIGWWCAWTSLCFCVKRRPYSSPISSCMRCLSRFYSLGFF